MSEVITGDSLEVLDDLDAESVHAVVTDPPYGLAFMERSWDDFEPREYQEWCMGWAEKALRVLKPGGHLLAFSGNRTHHRLFTGVEDAGFEVRDTLTWHYGSGFPKASDISKTIDKREGAEREVVGDFEGGGYSAGKYANENKANGRANSHNTEVTEPATDAAKKWDGWKTGLKPATEYIILARKPYSGATVDCVLEHGVGALNIDACRIGTEGGTRSVGKGEDSERAYGDGLNKTGCESINKGRFPANVLFDETQAQTLDQQTGELDAGAHTTKREAESVNTYSDKVYTGAPDTRTETDTGGASRYFYTSKATKAERTLNGRIENAHPTVKPQDLMEWLIRLVTREGQTILDPFTGSGTTLRAAKTLGREFIGIEQNERWADVARVRVGLTPEDPSVVRGDSGQAGIESFTD